MNHIVLMGRLTRDPELRHTQTGIPVATFTLAVDRGFTPKDGGDRQTDFIDIVAWRGTGEFVSKYFTRGKMCAVAGRLQIRDYVDKDNNKRKKAEVVAENVYFTESKRSSEGAAPYANAPYNTNNNTPYSGDSYQSNRSDYNSNTAGYTSPVASSDFSELDMDESDFPF